MSELQEVREKGLRILFETWYRRNNPWCFDLDKPYPRRVDRPDKYEGCLVQIAWEAFRKGVDVGETLATRAAERKGRNG